MFILMPYLKNICRGRWLNLEPEDRLSEAILFTLCAIRSLPINSGHFIPDLHANLVLHMDEQNRKAPPRFYGRDRSLDRQMAADNGDNNWNLYSMLACSEIDCSAVIVCSFLKSLPDWQKNLLCDLMEKGLSKSAAARKYETSAYQLEKTLIRMGSDYQSGNWEER